MSWVILSAAGEYLEADTFGRVIFRYRWTADRTRATSFTKKATADWIAATWPRWFGSRCYVLEVVTKGVGASAS